MPASASTIIAFQKRQINREHESEDEGIVPLIDSEVTELSGAMRYYSSSSLVSYMTLQSRYIVPPDANIKLKCSASTGGCAGNAVAGQYMGPSGQQPVYEFPKYQDNKYNQYNDSDAIFINWKNITQQYSKPTTNPNDPGISWISGETPYETKHDTSNVGNIKPIIPYPNVISSQFKSLKETKEFKELSARIGQIEQFLGKFSNITPDTKPTANFYLGLSGDVSIHEGSNNWADISSAGLWQQLV